MTDRITPTGRIVFPTLEKPTDERRFFKVGDVVTQDNGPTLTVKSTSVQYVNRAARRKAMSNKL